MTDVIDILRQHRIPVMRQRHVDRARKRAERGFWAVLRSYGIVLHALAALTIAVGSSPAAQAQGLPADFNLATRTLTLSTTDLERRILVVYDPGVAGSEAEARGLVEGKSSISLGGETIPVNVIPLSELARLGPGAGLIYFVTKINPDYETLARVTQGMNAVTASSDRACVEQGACVISARSRPRVEIRFNQAAADARGVTFKEQFLRLVKSV